MNKFVNEAKRRLQEENVNETVLTAMINVYINPDAQQRAVEEIYQLREENEKLKNHIESFVDKTNDLLNKIIELDLEDVDSKEKLKTLQNKASEWASIMELIELLA